MVVGIGKKKRNHKSERREEDSDQIEGKRRKA